MTTAPQVPPPVLVGAVTPPLYNPDKRMIGEP